LRFRLDQVRELLSLSDRRHRSCEAVDEIARANIWLTSITRLATSRVLRRELDALLRQCRHCVIAECRIIKALASKR